MLIPRFEYHAPGDIKDACATLNRLKGKACLLAGGTDIIVNMKKGAVSPENLISLNRVKLKYIHLNDESAGIGACTTAATLSRSEEIASRFSALAASAGRLGTPLIRNTATMGGNLVTARPAADFPPSLMAYGAKVILNSVNAERAVPLDGFFLGPGRTMIRDNEILTEIVLNYPPPFSGCGCIKLGVRKTLEISVVNVAAFLTLEKPDGPISNARIFLGAVAPVPMRARSAEQRLRGEKPDEGVFDSAAEAAAEESRPIDDFRASAAYRRDMVKVLTKRALRAALQDIKSHS